MDRRSFTNSGGALGVKEIQTTFSLIREGITVPSRPELPLFGACTPSPENGYRNFKPLFSDAGRYRHPERKSIAANRALFG